MVKFDEKGQGFWDFILENCHRDLITAVQFDLDDGFEILTVKKYKHSFKIYLKHAATIIIFTSYLLYEGKNEELVINRNLIGMADLLNLNEVINNVD